MRTISGSFFNWLFFRHIPLALIFLGFIILGEVIFREQFAFSGLHILGAGLLTVLVIVGIFPVFLHEKIRTLYLNPQGQLFVKGILIDSEIISHLDEEVFRSTQTKYGNSGSTGYRHFWLHLKSIPPELEKHVHKAAIHFVNRANLFQFLPGSLKRTWWDEEECRVIKILREAGYGSFIKLNSTT